MMSNKKQLVIRKLLTRKVQRLVETNREPIDATPVPNKWEDTLDNLFDDPDFQEVYSYNLLEFPCANNLSPVGTTG